jgi:hypothetical protein
MTGTMIAFFMLGVFVGTIAGFLLAAMFENEPEDHRRRP